MKKLYTCIVIILLACLYGGASAQGGDRLAAIKGRLDSLAVRDTAYLAEVDISVGRMPLSELLRSVAKVNGVSLSVKGAGDLLVTCNFSRARIADLLYFLCKEYNLDLDVIGNIVSIWPHADTPVRPPEPLIAYSRVDTTLSYDLIAAPLGDVARRITDSTGVNLVVPQPLYGRQVSGYVAGMPLAEAIFTLASTNGLEARRDKGGRTWTFEAAEQGPGAPAAPPSPYTRRLQFSESQLTVDSLGRITATIGQGNVYDIVLDVCEQLHLDYFFITPVNAQTSVFLNNADAETLFNVLFTGTPYTYYIENGVYMFGEAQDEKVFATKVIPMTYRTVDKLVDVIPENLKKGVQVAAFPDLNSIIASGDQRLVGRVEQFLRSIDKTVPLITIEVMIVDASKDVILEAGLGLGIGDKPAKTGGTLSPGVDMTVGAGSINQALDRAGIVKLGRVAPNFYANLRLMEENGTIELRSTPKLSTLNGHEATLTSGETQYYKETNNTYMGTQNPVQSTSYVWKNVEANMTLTITPFVSSDGHITMTIDLSQSEFTARTEKEAPPGTTTRSFKSMVRVQNSETVLLGGIDRNSREKSSQGLPFIARVPVLRWIFGKHKNNRQERRLNVFITPTVIY
ncbi:MAG: type II secretion system protein GspD [Rikenellaceae bacterium]|nr:type II secretion system protein GspD [Rikenellaceae bacterium]